MLQRGGSKGGKGGGKDGPRQVLTGDRINGRIVEWKGNHGWVSPFFPINDPAAAKRNHIFLSAADIEEDIDDVNPIVSFVVYKNNTGLGAQEVRSAGGRSPVGYGTRPVQMASGGRNPYVDSLAARATAPAPVVKEKMTHQQLIDKVHAALTTHVWPCVQEVHSMEESWSPEEMRKRVVRYLYKGSTSDERIMKMDWRRGLQHFIELATCGYKRACAEKPWFTELNLAPALAAAGWEVAQGLEGNPRPQKKEVEKLCIDVHAMQLHKLVIDTLMWEVLIVAFPLEEKRQTKFYNALSKSYNSAFQNTSNGKLPSRGFARAEAFVKDWVRSTLERIWAGFGEEAPDILNTEAVAEFFRGLLCPEDEETVSCIPPPFVVGQERSPEEWEIFLTTVISELFDAWAKQAGNSASAKKRKTAEPEEEELIEEEEVV